MSGDNQVRKETSLISAKLNRKLEFEPGISLYSTDYANKKKIKVIQDSKSAKQSPFLPPHMKILKAFDLNKSISDLVWIDEESKPEETHESAKGGDRSPGEDEYDDRQVDKS